MRNRPITFACKHAIAIAPTAISAALADVTRWRDFKGYGFLPGIARPVIWVISFFLKRAIDRQLVEMAQAATNSQESN